MIRRLWPLALALGFFSLSLAAPQPALALPPACDGTIYGDTTLNNNIYSFNPSVGGSALTNLGAVSYPGSAAGLGTIARGTKSGDLFLIDRAASNSAVYAVSTKAIGTATAVATLGNTAFVYAFGFDNTGTGYALSSSQSFKFLDNGTNATTPQSLGAPTTNGGPAITAFASGDIAFAQNGTAYTVLTTNGTTNLSYLYRIDFSGASPVLTLVAQITAPGGAAYAVGDLYDFAFGTGNIGYVTSYNNSELYSVNITTAALTDAGAQNAQLADLASCPFFPVPNPSILKTGPTAASVGDLIQYTIRTANDPTANSPAIDVVLADTIPTGIAILSATCAVTGATTCPTPTITGQNVSTTIPSLPAGGSATVTIYARDASLPLTPTSVTNTATFTADNALNDLSSTTLTVSGNTVNKTVANITTGTAATATTDTGSPHDVLQYVLSYGNVTGGPLSKFALNDVIPTNTTYVAGSATCPTVPAGFTCAITAPTAANGQTITFTYTPNAAGNTIPFETAVPAPAQVGATFRVTIN